MISFVVTARNDNYGGDFLQRMQAFINVLLGLSEKYHFNIELIIVEWNPPEDRVRLADVLDWPVTGSHWKARIIEVPGEIHRTLPHSDRLPLFEFIGKNVGIRRANGEYILVTNPDILFSEELVMFLAENKLKQNTFYRATRYDIDAAVPSKLTLLQQLEFCRRHIIQVNGKYFSYGYSMKNNPVFVFRSMTGLVKDMVWRIRHFPAGRPFTNASGDFLLMHRDHWNSLYGYPQLVGSDAAGILHIDSIMLYIAMFSGVKQKKLKESQRIYHQEHGRERSRTPYSSEIESARRLLLKEQKPVIFNDEKWGLGEYILAETTIC